MWIMTIPVQPAVRVGFGALVAALVLAMLPALLIAAGFAWAAWYSGWPPSRMRNFYIGAVLPMLILLPFYGWQTPFTEWWVGVEALRAGAYRVAFAHSLGLAVPVGMLVGWVWWWRYTARHRDGSTLMKGEQHQARQWRRRARLARHRALNVYTQLTKVRAGELVILLGHHIDRESTLPPTVPQQLMARHSWWLEVPMKAVDLHMAVLGHSGSGKSELLKRLSIGWTEGAWQSYVVDSSGRPTPRPLVIFANLKGDLKAEDEALAWCDAMVETGLHHDRVAAWPFDGRLDMWRMRPPELVESLHALARTAHPHYDVLQRAMLHLVIEAPGGPPRSSVEFLSRLDETWLRDRWQGHQTELATLDTLTKAGKNQASPLSVDALAMAELMRLLGWEFDAGRPLSDLDALYVSIPGMRSPAMAKAKAAAVVQLVVDELARHPRHVLFVLDEYSAVSDTVDVIGLVERLRSMGGAVVVGAQSWEGLAGNDDARSRLLSAMGGGYFVLASPNPDPLTRFGAGTRRRMEASRVTEEARWQDRGQVRVQDTFLLNPNRVRALEPGQAAYVRAGTVSWGHVCLMRGRQGGQMSRVVIDHPARALPVARDRMTYLALEAGQTSELERHGIELPQNWWRGGRDDR